MFPPISEFNFVFASIATVAATVGYAFTRNKGVADSMPIPCLSSSSDASSSSMEEKRDSPQRVPVAYNAQSTRSSSPCPTARRGSLKRKVPDGGFDEPTPDIGYPFNLANIYPNKRCKTPPSPVQTTEEEADTTQTTPFQPAPSQPSVAPADEDVEIPHVGSEGTQDKDKVAQACLPDPAIPRGISPSTPVVETPAPEPPRTPTPPLTASHVSKEPTSVLCTSTHPTPMPPPTTLPPAQVPQPAFGTLTPPLTRPSTPSAQFGTTLTAPRSGIATPSPFASSSSSTATRGFAAFAGSTSPFASVKKDSFASLAASSPSAFSAFSQQNTEFGGVVGAFGGLLGEQDTGAEQQKGNGKKKEQDHAIDAVEVKDAQVKVTHVTGEEEEDVEQELKGVKLFVKRGNKPFASGMVGHLKLLSDRKTLKERLLFRREPLWQASMNVKINSAVRCTYDPEENAIRLVLKEPVEGQLTTSSKDHKLEVVVYALKPGRACSKQDFKDFAESLLKNARFTKAEDAAISK